MEFWDVLDRKGNRTGKTVVRGKRGLQKGEYHLVVHIWVIDENNRFLIQRRSEDKLLMPGEWAATGGAALSGESSRRAASRELFEELGVKVNRRDIILLESFVRKNSINDVWYIKINASKTNFTLQEEEVAEVRWSDKDTLKIMVENGEFHNYGNDYFNIIYSLAE